MNITCEHCGCAINIDKDKKCPNCGAPYSRNKEYIELKRQQKQYSDMDLKEKEIDIHSKELNNKILEKTLNTTDKFKAIPLIIGLVFFMIFILAAFLIFKSFNTSTIELDGEQKIPFKIDEKFFNNTLDEIEEEEDKTINVSFNENAVDEDYEIKIDKITNYKYDKFETEKYRGKNINYYNFHIVFKNKTDSFLLIEHYITLQYTDSNGNEGVVAKIHNPNIKESKSQIEMTASNKGTYTGNLTFEIPKSVKDVKITYKNAVITINDFKKLIK